MACRYLSSRVSQPAHRDGLSIQFVCGFHGRTGGPEAIAGIANLLSRAHKVFFLANATSEFNQWLTRQVRRNSRLDKDADIFICDRSVGRKNLQTIAATGKPVIASIHGRPSALHGLRSDDAFTIFEFATHCHFVSSFQAEAFGDLAKNSFVIPNRTSNFFDDGSPPSGKSFTVGMVGYFVRPSKNLEGNLSAARQSQAESILVWGNSESMPHDERVQFRGYSADQKAIFNSFDVFLSLSKDETFGLVVVQALSAGKPCVLSDIPAHRAYKDCPGVTLVDIDDHQAAAAALDKCFAQMGEQANEIRHAIQVYWAERYSDQPIADQWMAAIEKIAGPPSSQ